MRFSISRTSEYEKEPTGGALPTKDGRNWEIEIGSLDDLLALYEREGPIIIDGDFYENNQYKIEIYDDYRE